MFPRTAAQRKRRSAAPNSECDVKKTLRITKTCNAGVLIEYGSARALFDGVCGEVPPYAGTPAHIRRELSEDIPDIVAFTHTHPDHWDGSFARAAFIGGRCAVLMPGGQSTASCGDLMKVSAVRTRHLGKPDFPHVSYLLSIQDRTVWIAGDASPDSLVSSMGPVRPDIAVVPYSYLLTVSAAEKISAAGAKTVIVVHMPAEGPETAELTDSVRANAHLVPGTVFPETGETLAFE